MSTPPPSDNGRSWTLTSDGIPPSQTVLRVAATEPAVALRVDLGRGRDRSLHCGLELQDASGVGVGALGDDTARAFLTAPSTYSTGGRLLVGTQKGVWATKDNGDTWGQMTTSTALAQPSMGDQIVWSLGLGFTPLALMAGTQANLHRDALPLTPITAGTNPTIAPSTGITSGRSSLRSNGTWNGTAPFLYQWRRCDSSGGSCQNIAATSKDYAATDDDAAGANKTLRVVVTASNLVLGQRP